MCFNLIPIDELEKIIIKDASYLRKLQLFTILDAVITDDLGYKCWIKNGRLHRDDGPAIFHQKGAEYWYKDGRLHRDKGPAIKLTNGFTAYFKHGRRLVDLDKNGGASFWT